MCFFDGSGRNILRGGKWGTRGREAGGEGEGSGGKGGREAGVGDPLSTPTEEEMPFIQAFRLPSDPIHHCTLSCILYFKEVNNYYLNQPRRQVFS